MKTPLPHPVLNGGTWGAMSGENPKFPSSIEATHNNLVRILRKMGLKFQETQGQYDGKPERSVIIHRPREDQMKTLGKLFGQESVIHSVGAQHKLQYTNGPHEGGHRGIVPGAPPHEWFSEPPTDAYTHLPSNGYFRCNFDFEGDPIGTKNPTVQKSVGKSIFARLRKNYYHDNAVMSDAIKEAGGKESVEPDLNPSRDFYPGLGHRQETTKPGVCVGCAATFAPSAYSLYECPECHWKTHEGWDRVSDLGDQYRDDHGSVRSWEPPGSDSKVWQQTAREVPVQNPTVGIPSPDRSAWERSPILKRREALKGAEATAREVGLIKAWPKDKTENQANATGFLNNPVAQDAYMEGTGAQPQTHGYRSTYENRELPKPFGVRESLAMDSRTMGVALENPDSFTTGSPGSHAWTYNHEHDDKYVGQPVPPNAVSNLAKERDSKFWSHPHSYEWHDGHTAHHNAKPWDKQDAITTARNLGLIKNVPGDPAFDRQFNVFHEADHGSYRMSGGFHNRLQNQQSIELSYAPRRSLIPGRAGRFVSLGVFPDKHQAEAARLGHHDRVAAGLHKAEPTNDQAAGVGVSTYARFAAPYGQVNKGQPSNLFHYDYKNKLKEVNDLVKRHGYQVYYGGGQHGQPDLAHRNYNTGHLMIYDPTPASGGDFGQRDYTDAWRQIHELAHALTYKDLNNVYGEGRRMGKLGVHRTMNEAMRAVHWEHLAAHKQRELSKQIGVHVPDEVFNKEYNTVMHDAVHRAVTGKFTEPSQEGFVPHSHQVPLQTALDMVRSEGSKMGLQGHHDVLARKSEPKYYEVKLEKAWPKNQAENDANAGAHAVMEDAILEQGGSKQEDFDHIPDDHTSFAPGLGNFNYLNRESDSLCLNCNQDTGWEDIEDEYAPPDYCPECESKVVSGEWRTNLARQNNERANRERGIKSPQDYHPAFNPMGASPEGPDDGVHYLAAKGTLPRQARGPVDSSDLKLRSPILKRKKAQ